MGTVISTLGIPVNAARPRAVRVLLPASIEAPVVMFARARRPGHAWMEALVALVMAAAVFTCAAMVVREVARAHGQVQAASDEYAAAGLKLR
jgi:hypothetical protein